MSELGGLCILPNNPACTKERKNLDNTEAGQYTKEERRSKLVFHAQSTGAVISARQMMKNPACPKMRLSLDNTEVGQYMKEERKKTPACTKTRQSLDNTEVGQ